MTPPPTTRQSSPQINGWRVTAVVLIAVAVLAWLVIPNLLAAKISRPWPAAAQNAYAVYQAQQQYHEQHHCYADSGAKLFQANLIAADLAKAFEVWQDNGDAATPAPKAGYFFRMLQGSNESPTAYRLAKPPAANGTGLTHWCLIARPANPGTSGEVDYLFLENGQCYSHVVTVDSTDPQYGRYLLDGDLTAAQLQQQGWKKLWDPAGND